MDTAPCTTTYSLLEVSRLRGLRIYLSGNCECANNDGGDWRKEVTAKLKMLGLIVFDPVNSPTTMSWGVSKKEEFDYVRNLRSEERYDDLANCVREIVHVDLRSVDSADVLLVQIDTSIPTYGTIDEIVTAINQKKPVYICSKQGMKTMPIWFFGRIPLHYMFEDIDGILTELQRIAYCSEQELHDTLDRKRWLFVNRMGV